MAIPQIAVVFNWRNEKNASGLFSIYLRITIDRASRYYRIPVPKKISKAQWNGKDGNWVKNHDFSFEVNNKIAEKRAALNDLIKRNYSLNKPVTFKAVFEQLGKKGTSNSFYSYMEAFIKNPPERLEVNTIKKYNTCLTHLREFRPELYFSEIESTLLQDFQRFLQIKKDLQGSSCKKYMESMKRVIRQARKENYIDPSQMEFLFDDIKIKVGQAKRTFLDADEIRKWKEVIIPKHQEHLARDRDLFLFQIYTGYYYKDLPIFTKDQLYEDEEFGFFIIGARDKNGNQTIIPLFKFPHAASLIQKYRSGAQEKTIFAPHFFVEEPAYNRNLKEIAALAKIKKSISNKVARHSNAQLWIRYGAERPILSKMLGHKKEETTKHYYSINIPEIVEGTKRVDFGKLRI